MKKFTAEKNSGTTGALARAALLTSLLVLAWHPMVWLVTTWFDPSYDSAGEIIFLACLALFLWSVSSPAGPVEPGRSVRALTLLQISALIRLAGQVLAVNVVGAAPLVLDVYAAAYLCGLDRRRRAVSPAWLAALFALSLPLERIVQRILGFGLQHVSADGAAALLNFILSDVSRNGLRLLVDGREILVDAPCSGARGLMNIIAALTLVLAVRRPGALQGLVALLAAGLSAVIANMVRVTILSLGLARPGLFLGLDVLSSPWHDLIGLVSLALGLAPLLLWARRAPARPKQPATPGRKLRTIRKIKAPTAAVFLVCSIIITTLPARPLDVGRADPGVSPPPTLGNIRGRPAPLSPREEAYFTQYGGSAAKMSYGRRLLLLVRTSAPLRHIHAPDECLRGLGFRVQYVGFRPGPLPAALYRAESPDGRVWRVAVTYISNQGARTVNVSETIWRWIRDRGGVWLAVQRITPWDETESESARWDLSLAAALDLAEKPEAGPDSSPGAQKPTAKGDLS